jgi:hypothetical protein
VSSKTDWEPMVALDILDVVVVVVLMIGEMISWSLRRFLLLLTWAIWHDSMNFSMPMTFWLSCCVMLYSIFSK